MYDEKTKYIWKCTINHKNNLYTVECTKKNDSLRLFDVKIIISIYL